MPDFRIYPATATLSTTGSANMIGSGSTANPTIFSVNGNNGRLLEVTDDLSDSIFSANTIAGLPVIEAFANNCVVLGQYSGHQLRVTCTSIAGGKYSTASGTFSFIGGGCGNTASGYNSTVAGGCNNRSCGFNAFIGGGADNLICDSYSVVTSGICNRVLGVYGFIGGGSTNLVSGNYAASVVGGLTNTASGGYAFTGGGYLNTASGNYSSVLGGRANTASGAFSSAVGCGITASSACYFYANNICNVSGGTSDCRMKHSICPITYNLDQIAKLKPTSFIFNGDCSNFKRYGFIAQEVCQVIPDIITHHPIDKIDNKGNVGGNVVGDPVLQFEKDAVFASYVNAFKELKDRLEVVEAILKNNNLM